MFSRLGLGRCRAERARADVESSGPGLMSSRLGSGRFWVVWARADVESFEPGRCQVVRAQDVEWSRPGPMLSRVGPRRSSSKLSRIMPSSSQISVCTYQNGFNVFDKVDLI